MLNIMSLYGRHLSASVWYPRGSWSQPLVACNLSKDELLETDRHSH